MKVLKYIVLLCFVAICALVFLTYIQLPEVREYDLEMSSISPFYSGFTFLDVITSSFYYLVTAPTITSGLLVFMYFVGVGAAAYTGLILGLIVSVAERKRNTDFLFMLSFTACLFFAIFTTVVAILL